MDPEDTWPHKTVRGFDCGLLEESNITTENAKVSLGEVDNSFFSMSGDAPDCNLGVLVKLHGTYRLQIVL